MNLPEPPTRSRGHRHLWAATLLTLAGCTQTVVFPSPSTTASSSGGRAPSTSAAAASSSGSSSSGSSSGGSSGQSSSQSSSGTSSGSSTGAPPPTFVDGGFVFCTLPDTGSGAVNWLCPPGSYFCDVLGTPGNCFQCRSDSDCRDQNLPTYDPLRPRCDLDSGIPGYQSFCQECLDNADCSGSAAGRVCDLNPNYPVDAIGVRGSSLEPSIETLGFETCQKLQVDCRLDGGPDCVALGEVCDSKSGVCSQRAGTCADDMDCAGLLTAVQIGSVVGAISLPFCASGECNACAGGVCPIGNCLSDADCGNPTHSPAGPSCDTAIGACTCRSSSQCAGVFPACTSLDSGLFDDAGEALGFCGCTSDADCGDAGLRCFPGSYQGNANAGFCGVPCTAPDFTSCSAFVQGNVCDPASGLCVACGTDLQCAQDPHAGGKICTSAEMGTRGPCGCLSDSDCVAGESCDAPVALPATSFFSLGLCTPTMSRCTPSSCGGYFCNWLDGGCVNDVDLGAVPSCLDDYDCVAANLSDGPGPPLFCISGACDECRDNADCRTLAAAGLEAVSATHCCQRGSPDCPNASVCTTMCDTDADCVGNPTGTGCVSAFSTTLCACNKDQDCASVAGAPQCDLQVSPGTCQCSADSDCPAGQSCQLDSPTHSSCTAACASDFDCAVGFFCHPTGNCLPRCDVGHACQAPDPACDVGNIVGQNGDPDAGVIWCYACLNGNDCSDGLGCDSLLVLPFCGSCATGFTGCGNKACVVADKLCHSTCATHPCPAGEVCDTLGLAGNGANICYQCVTAADCPDGQGCDRETHTCGTCEGPTAAGAPSDCPPDAVCSNYWGGAIGVCLQNCDRVPCPSDRPLCQTLPALTPDHAYCFGCLSDADCADAGKRCDTSVDLTFSCR